ncbi:hypothetical protein BFF78_13005 [Streptomyces fodineus]|uniref:SUKH-3 domain containing protein n=1 Tax=Streptomyces fodineus TaxID=1904616 RepID=A0A1D7Y8B0_9ACTN|nr:hypothetical protein [Streptomyces fodineus]AOR31845.1 hypothetical protein BFF78_13005 [Streptomyces fodineus]
MTREGRALPDGWTVDRLRAHSGDTRAVALCPDRLVYVEDGSGGDPEPLHPSYVLAFGELCLVDHDGEWYMGSLRDDGSVACWASYGSDLAEAIRSL